MLKVVLLRSEIKKECPPSPSIAIVLEGPCWCSKARKKNLQSQEEPIKMALFIHGMIIYLENLKDSYRKNYYN